MKKKHYVLIAECIRNVIRVNKLNEQQADSIVRNFGDTFIKDNKKFDYDKFRGYILGDEYRIEI